MLPPMIPFDEIETRLKLLRKNRQWLAEASGRPADSVRVALAPNAPKAKRSRLLQRALSDAIERETIAQAEPPKPEELPDRITIICPPNKMNIYHQVVKAQETNLLDWTMEELDRAASEWFKSNPHNEIAIAAEVVDDTHKPLPPPIFGKIDPKMPKPPAEKPPEEHPTDETPPE
jgi:hypothetical protein